MSIKTLVHGASKGQWRQSEETGIWSLSLGRYGCSVLVTQRTTKEGKAGPFFAVTRIGGRRCQKRLKTIHRTEARDRAEAFLVKLLQGQEAPTTPLTIEVLWEMYRDRSGGYQQNTELTKKSKASSVRRLIAAFGNSKRVDLLTKNDVERYLGNRLHNGSLGVHRKGIGTRASVDDLCVLRAMVRWALNERLPDGSWLLQENPLRGVKLPKEESPLRPVISVDRFERIRTAAQKLAVSNRVASRNRWIRFDLALVVAEATGARIGSIRGLRWSDIDYENSTIRWAPEFHKRRRESVVPLPTWLRDELKSFQVRLQALGDTWLFPSTDQVRPWPREIFTQLWVEAEKEAGLAHLKGGCWHTLRRKWAIERKHFSPVDVAGAGGWKDLSVLQTIYQIPTHEGMLEVMEYRGRLRESRGVSQ